MAKIGSDNTNGENSADRVRKFGLLTYLAMSLIVFGSVGADQLTKVVAENNLMVWSDTENLRMYQGQRFPLGTMGTEDQTDLTANNFVSLSFNYVRNQGAAWGFLSDLDDNIRDPFFYFITFMAVLVIGYYFRSTPYHHRLARFALAMILSGAFGNFLDRIRLGYVIDFIDVRWNFVFPFTLDLSFIKEHWVFDHWMYFFPNFNWADSMITVGVSFLLIDLLFLEGKRKQEEEEQAGVASPA